MGHGDHMAIWAHMVPEIFILRYIYTYIPEHICVRDLYDSVTGHDGSVLSGDCPKWVMVTIWLSGPIWSQQSSL